MKMSPKVKKEAPAPPKAKAKIKALKTKKGYWKVSTAQKKKKKKIWMSPTFRLPKTLWLRRRPKDPGKRGPRRNKPDHCAIIRSPLPPSQP